jgi:alkanesulfonate monooxygenase SsuD/methylene tetrahydromethanopterin reductase-like flavin-dependent oxidoreductase (luciferase family)
MKKPKPDLVQLATDYIAGKIDLTPKQRGTLIERLAKKSGRPADIDSRICFGIHFYDSEEKARYATLITQVQGNTYNGGWFHGMACGRDTSFDYTVTQEHLNSAKPHDALITQGIKVGTKLYAVTN